MKEISSSNEFENRIHQTKLKRNRVLIIKISCISLVFLLLIIYFVTPISQVAMHDIKGNIYLSEADIINQAGLTNSSSLYTISETSIKDNLKKNPLIKGEPIISISPLGLKIEIEEKAPVFTYQNEVCLLDYSYLDSSVKESSNEIVKSYLKTYTTDLITLNTEMKETFFPKQKYTTLSKIILKMDEKTKSNIKSVSYSRDCFQFYFSNQTFPDADLVLSFQSEIQEVDGLTIVHDENIIEIRNYIEAHKNAIVLQEDKNHSKICLFNVTILPDGSDTHYLYTLANNDGIHVEI